MAAALGMEITAHRLLESRDRVERATLTALVVKAGEAHKALQLAFISRLWGGEDG